MAKFFVGQRVRIVGCHDFYDLEAQAIVGSEAIVNELECEGEDGFKGNVGITVGCDEGWCFLPEELEPILPEGAQPSEFSFTELMDNLGVVVA